MHRLVHFEIHVENVERAKAFYESVLGWEYQAWPIPDGKGGTDTYWGVITGPESEKGINGGLVQRRGPAPADGAPVNAFVCTMTVADVDASVQKALGAGGTLALPKFTIPGVGDMAYCKDTEGNIFGLHREEARPA